MNKITNLGNIEKAAVAKPEQVTLNWSCYCLIILM